MNKMADPQEPEIEVRNGVTVVALGPDYDSLEEHLLEGLEKTLTKCGREADPPLIVLDLSHTSFFGSSFIQILLGVWKDISEKPGSAFALSGMNSNCADVIRVTQLDKLWQIYGSADEAVVALSQSS